MVAAVLRAANCSLPRSFKALVNDKGSVTLVVTDTSVPASSYAPYFEALTTKLNQSFPIGDNPWLPFWPAPTFVQLAIHSLPISLMPYEDSLIYDKLQESILNSQVSPFQPRASSTPIAAGALRNGRSRWLSTST